MLRLRRLVVLQFLLRRRGSARRRHRRMGLLLQPQHLHRHPLGHRRRHLRFRKIRSDAMKTPAAFPGFLCAILPAGCAGPLGPALGFGPGLDPLAGLVFVGLVVLLAYQPLRRILITHRRSTASSPAQAIVKERYARGEITADEYERLMRHLSQT